MLHPLPIRWISGEREEEPKKPEKKLNYMENQANYIEKEANYMKSHKKPGCFLRIFVVMNL